MYKKTVKLDVITLAFTPVFIFLTDPLKNIIKKMKILKRVATFITMSDLCYRDGLMHNGH